MIKKRGRYYTVQIDGRYVGKRRKRITAYKLLIYAMFRPVRLCGTFMEGSIGRSSGLDWFTHK